nr:MAG TPA: hypothetical protein [Caudoviricetes sp.]
MKVKTKIHPDLGEVFEYEGIKVKCVADDNKRYADCSGCAFQESPKCDTICCAYHEREDERGVHFEKVD